MNKQVDFLVIDMSRSDWITQIQDFSPDFCVCRPPGDITLSKRNFDEKLYFLEKHTGYAVYPGFGEVFIYENKAALSYFLQVNNIPHPKTFVSYSQDEAEIFAANSTYPIVAKTLIGAAGSGVRVLKNIKAANDYIKMVFSKGVKRRYGPNRKTGNPLNWFIKAMRSPTYFWNKIIEYGEKNDDIQKNVVFFQQFIPHEFEWRCVKIGESFFAYKKMKIGDKASGAKMFEYESPPLSLLNFTKEICERFEFNFMAVDVFIYKNQIYVNELQTIFGHKNPFICKVDGKIGRYIFAGNEWMFEEGDFNCNESYCLRLDVAIDLFKSQVKNKISSL